MVVLFLGFWGTSTVPSYIHTSNVEGFPFLHIIPSICCLWDFFWALCCVPLIRVSVFLPVSYYLDYYISVVQIEVREGDASSPTLFFSRCFCYSECFVFPYQWITTNNCMPIKWIIYKKWIPRNVQSSRTEPNRNRKYE